MLFTILLGEIMSMTETHLALIMDTEIKGVLCVDFSGESMVGYVSWRKIKSLDVSGINRRTSLVIFVFRSPKLATFQ